MNIIERHCAADEALRATARRIVLRNRATLLLSRIQLTRSVIDELTRLVTGNQVAGSSSTFGAVLTLIRRRHHAPLSSILIDASLGKPWLLDVIARSFRHHLLLEIRWLFTHSTDSSWKFRHFVIPRIIVYPISLPFINRYTDREVVGLCRVEPETRLILYSLVIYVIQIRIRIGACSQTATTY